MYRLCAPKIKPAYDFRLTSIVRDMYNVDPSHPDVPRALHGEFVPGKRAGRPVRAEPPSGFRAPRERVSEVRGDRSGDRDLSRACSAAAGVHQRLHRAGAGAVREQAARGIAADIRDGAHPRSREPDRPPSARGHRSRPARSGSGAGMVPAPPRGGSAERGGRAAARRALHVQPAHRGARHRRNGRRGRSSERRYGGVLLLWRRRRL